MKTRTKYFLAALGAAYALSFAYKAKAQGALYTNAWVLEAVHEDDDALSLGMIGLFDGTARGWLYTGWPSEAVMIASENPEFYAAIECAFSVVGNDTNGNYRLGLIEKIAAENMPEEQFALAVVRLLDACLLDYRASTESAPSSTDMRSIPL